MRRLAKLCTCHTIDLFILPSRNYRPFPWAFSSFLYFQSFCVVCFYSLPGGFDRFPRCGVFCNSILMVIPCVHLFTELPSFFFLRFHFPCTWQWRPSFLNGVWPLNIESTLNQNVADDHLFVLFCCFVLFFIFFLPFYIDSRCSRKLLWVGLKLNLWLSFA